MERFYSTLNKGVRPTDPHALLQVKASRVNRVKSVEMRDKE